MVKGTDGPHPVEVAMAAVDVVVIPKELVVV